MMLISAMIKKLETIKAEHGNISVNLDTDFQYCDMEGSFIPVEDLQVEECCIELSDDGGESFQKIVSLVFDKNFILERD